MSLRGVRAVVSRPHVASGSADRCSPPTSRRTCSTSPPVPREEGLDNVDTAVLDGEQLDVEEASFDAVISRVGCIYFPDQQAPLRGMWRALKGPANSPASSTPWHRQTSFSQFPCRSSTTAELPPPASGQPGPLSFGEPGLMEAA